MDYGSLVNMGYKFDNEDVVREYNKLFYQQYGISVISNKQKIIFNHNYKLPIHRWSPYVQGFSASFVDRTLDMVSFDKNSIVLDPFVGSGTVCVCAKMRGIESIGIDLNPLLHFTSDVKTKFDLDVKKVNSVFNKIDWNSEVHISPPSHLKNENHFSSPVLKDLLRLKQFIWDIDDEDTKQVFKLAFASILVNCSNLKRSPCLGYAPNKVVPRDAVRSLFKHKMHEIIEDLKFAKSIDKKATAIIKKKDSKEFKYEPQSIDIAITSPPYASGMDYIINYKMELSWLDFVNNHKDLKRLKDSMVVCDNVSRGLMVNYRNKKNTIHDEWLDKIIEEISNNIILRGKYRRNDMPFIVSKYFDDLSYVMKNVYEGLKDGGKFILVIGDSLISDVYVPTDLIIARIGSSVGFTVKSVELARYRYSGQRRDFKLRETITTLCK